MSGSATRIIGFPLTETVRGTMAAEAGEACQGLKFKPGEGCLGDTLSQLLADAGLKPGGKRGQNGQQGAGGGYSARRSTLNNIGMYGQIPTRGNPTQSRGGSGKQAISGSGNFGTSADRARASRLDPHGMLNASGTSDAAKHRAATRRPDGVGGGD